MRSLCIKSCNLQVLMNVEDKLVNGTILVLDGEKGRASLTRELGSVRPSQAGDEDPLRGGTSITDGSDSGLNGLDPRGELDVMWLVHDAEDDTLLVLVLGCELAPDVGELLVGRATLADDSTVPPGVVVQVDDDVRLGALGERELHGLVIPSEEALGDGTANRRLHKLPGEGDTEDIHTLASEVGELSSWRFDASAGDRTIGVDAEVVAGHVDYNKSVRAFHCNWSKRKHTPPARKPVAGAAAIAEETA
jgi:hypothetical protein